MERRIYIEDLMDLNYRGVILYIGKVDATKLRAALEKAYVNKMWRLDNAINSNDPTIKNYIFIENCDLQDLDYPVHEYIEEGYDVYNLYEDAAGKYYVKNRL
jgi:hypothetical protein